MSVALDSTVSLEAIRSAVARLIGLEEAGRLGPDDDLIGEGLDSISMMRLAGEWQREGVEVKFAELVERPTLRAWHELVRTRRGAAASSGGRLSWSSVDEQAPFALATLQLAYWIGRAPEQPLGSGAHFYAELDGEGVAVDRLEGAVRALIARHGMLRARFLEDGTQRIDETSPWPGVTVHDFGDAGGAVLAARLGALRRRLAHRRLPVELGQGFDVQLSLLPGGRTRLHLEVDMLIADARSFRILIADLARYYDRPEDPPVPLGYSYPRYLAEQRSRRAGALASARDYWSARLPELPGPPLLPLAREPEQVLDPETTRRFSRMSGRERERLAARAAEGGVTLSIVFVAAFAEVVAAWSAKPRFLLNLPFYDRELLHPDVDVLVGDFTNVILLEVDGSPELPFLERARRLQAQLQRDALHAEHSGVDVLRDLARARPGEPVGAPVVFTSAISLGELFDADVRRCFGAPTWTASQTPQVWLDCQVTEREGGLYLNWDAVEELFPVGVLDGMFGAFERLLAWLARAGSDWSGGLPCLVPGVQLAVRERVNATAGPVPVGGLHEGFFARAVVAPERPAVLWGEGGALSYGELRRRALALAGVLVARGVAPGEAVGVSLPKGSGQVEAVLGVLAAGALYVPVGVEQPIARRARILASAGARFVVCEAGVELPAGVRGVALAGVDVGEGLAGPRAVGAGALAYIIYTSGSTGEPKGVMVTHRAAMNTIAGINDRFGVGAEDRALAVSALDFDLSVYDIFGLLDRGGALVIPDQHARREAAAWLTLAHRHAITVWNSVPALLDMLLVTAEDRGMPASLRLALVSGDWVGLDLPSRLAAAAPKCRFVALGGATEAAIWSNAIEVERVDPAWRSIPYGFPLPNQRFRVVDQRGRDCPDWVPGELWIGGAGVAEGYRGDPERSALQFVVHDGTRWYRTGDVGRYWPDGTLEFLGRRDHQVKIRGHRIELGEVESALEAHPDVRGAVALATGAPTRRLVAVVAAAAGLELDGLRAFAAERLPAHMLPVRLEVCEQLPLSANGKVDRRAIERLLAGGEDSGSARARELPRGPVELAVAAAWSELLEVRDLARGDDFFALGGDSLLATRLVESLRRRFGVELSLRRLFASPTVAGLAGAIAELEGERSDGRLEEGVV